MGSVRKFLFSCSWSYQLSASSDISYFMNLQFAIACLTPLHNHMSLIEVLPWLP